MNGEHSQRVSGHMLYGAEALPVTNNYYDMYANVINKELADWQIDKIIDLQIYLCYNQELEYVPCSRQGDCNSSKRVQYVTIDKSNLSKT